MSWVITGAEKTPVDKLGIQSVSLLLHGDGTNGSTTITDSSPSPKTVTAVGNAQISTTQSKFGGASIAFDGSGDYLSIPASSDFLFGTGAFTIEAWIYLLATGQQHVYEARTSGNGVLLYVNALTQLSFYSNGATRLTGETVATGQWNHIAVTRSSGETKLFLNGTPSASIFYDSQYYNSPTTSIFIGTNGVGGSYVNGYIDDLRITKGVARYTSNFTPPTAPFPDI